MGQRSRAAPDATPPNVAVFFFPNDQRDKSANPLELPEGSWSAPIQIAGRGEAAAEIIARLNSLTSPFDLRWRRESRWPWDWKLVRVSNPALEISGDYY